MLNRCTDVTLVWFVLLSFVASALPAIYCTTDTTIESRCICNEVQRVDWSKAGEEPAPRPTNMSLRLIHGNSKNIDCGVELSVTWTQKANDFESDFVEGYDIEATISSSNSPKYFECFPKNITTSGDLVSFVFNTTAPSSWCPIRPGEKITYMINARPRYGKNDEPSSIEMTIQIPFEDYSLEPQLTNEDSSDFKGVHLSTSIDALITSTVSEFNVTKSGWHFYVASGVVIALGMVVLLLVLFVCRKTYHGQNPEKLRTILVIGNINDPNSVKICNELIETLKQRSGENVEIETNIRRSMEVGESGILDWIGKRIKKVGVVVFIVLDATDYATTSNDQKMNDLDGISQVALAMKAAQTVSLHQPRTFRSKANKCIAYGTCKPQEVHFCRYYNMELEQKQFLKHALGTLCKANGSTKKTSVAGDTDPMLENTSIDEDCCTLKNNLNVSTRFETEYATSSFDNIMMTHVTIPLESIENNEMV